MKTTKYLIGVVAAAALVGCNDLDTEPMGSLYTEGQRQQVVEADPATIEAQMSAVYANLYAFEASYSDLNDFGYPSIMLSLENRGQDMAMQNVYGWFYSDEIYTDNTPTSSTTTIMWGTLYNTIFSANDLISMINPATEETELLCYLGQAKAMRAWAYMQLAQLYCKPYSVNPQAPGVPVITELNKDENLNTGTPRGTVAQVYEQIMNDLNDAVSLLNDNFSSRYDKRFVDPAVALGLRARANLLMENWADALSDAGDAYQTTDADFASIEDASMPGFNSFANRDFMWGIHLDTSDAHGLYTFAGMMGSLTYGYAYAGQWRTINPKLWEIIPDGDIRKSWWINPVDYRYSPLAKQVYGIEVGYSILDNYIVDNSMVLDPYGNYAFAYPYVVGMPDYAVVKFAPYQNELLNSTGATDIPLMRVEEMLYIQMEAACHLGQWTAAKSLLEQFVNGYRWEDQDGGYMCMASSEAEMLDEVWFQRRIEFWGEGISYFDCLRLQKGIDRTGGDFPAAANFNIPANDDIYQFLIPTREMEANPLIGQQNPSSQPTMASGSGNPYWYNMH